MELEQVQTIISHVLDEIQSDQIDSLVQWLHDQISKYRLARSSEFHFASHEHSETSDTNRE